MKDTLTRVQKEVLGLLLLAAILSSTIFYIVQHPANEHPGMIRLHVVANSDTPEDQLIKRKVRNEILAVMEGQATIEEARSYIDGHLPELESVAKQVVDDYGAQYGVRACHKVTFIPEKSYEDLTLPAGNYEALRITLGDGKGQNWWCVIFPQLCLIGEDAGNEKLILKSRIKEMMIEQEKRADPA